MENLETEGSSTPSPHRYADSPVAMTAGHFVARTAVHFKDQLLWWECPTLAGYVQGWEGSVMTDTGRCAMCHLRDVSARFTSSAARNPVAMAPCTVA